MGVVLVELLRKKLNASIQRDSRGCICVLREMEMAYWPYDGCTEMTNNNAFKIHGCNILIYYDNIILCVNNRL